VRDRKDLRPRFFAPHVENIGADAVAVAEDFFARQHRSRRIMASPTAEIDNDSAIFHALRAVDDSPMRSLNSWYYCRSLHRALAPSHDHLLAVLGAIGHIPRAARVGVWCRHLRAGIGPAGRPSI